MTQINQETLLQLKTRMKARFPQLLEVYKSDLEKHMTGLNENWPDGDLDEITRRAHSVKSASALLGIEQFSDYARTIEQEGKGLIEQGAADFHSLDDTYRELVAMYPVVKKELDNELGKLE